MSSAALLFIIWTWGITPLWVNIVVTSLVGVKTLLDCIGE